MCVWCVVCVGECGVVCGICCGWCVGWCVGIGGCDCGWLGVCCVCV